MRRITGGKVEANSGHEARVLSRAATYGKKDTTPNVPITHLPDLPLAADEVEFFDRSLKYGHDPVVNKTVAQLAERGLRAVVASGKIYRSIGPAEASQFLRVLEASKPGPQSQLPSLPTDELARRIDRFYPPEVPPIAAELAQVENERVGQNIVVYERDKRAA